MTKQKEIVAVGRRKTAVAAVRLRPGKGKINVSHRDFEVFFPLEIQRQTILSPLEKTEMLGKFDIIVRVKGGGLEGQVTATRLGIARALEKDDESRRQVLKNSGYLTRDPRMRERKKYGKAGARKSFQFSKR